ncbi:MAG: NAD(P)/FAD-dependent oxidoreductase [Acidobacteriota bacterium]|nr:NAD(P)/FAD-dependent oxidoreductase [Acidobacteriota bacterium]
MTRREEVDAEVVVVGAGHNALICAAYLAEAGLRVTVLEANAAIGGNTITEELTLPGWQHDSCSSAHVVIQTNPLLADDELALKARYGLDYVVTDPAVVVPLDDGDALIIHSDLEATAQEFARFSPDDAQALRDMMREWSDGLRDAHAHVQAGLDPPNDEWRDRYERLRARSAWDVVRTTFTHPVIQRAMAWMAFATIQPPTRAGTGALPAAIVAGRLRFGWATPKGGSGALPAALRRHLDDHGATVEVNARVEHYLVEQGRCVGVVTKDGRAYRATRAVVSGAHLTTLPSSLPVRAPVLEDAAARWQPGLSVFAVHFALRDHVSYQSARGPLRAVAGALGSPAGLVAQVDAALRGELDAHDPWLLIVDSTLVDEARAPGTTLKFLTVAPMLLNGEAWSDEAANRYADHLIELARRHVTGLDDANILARRVESPTSLAAHNPANLGGSCHGGEFVLDDGSIIPGWLDYRGDVEGLYLTGSTSHPGGSVSGRPGRNSARVVLRDLGLDTSFMRQP